MLQPTSAALFCISLVLFAIATSAQLLQADELSGASAVITSPVNGAKLAGASVTFTWTSGASVKSYHLRIGDTPGAREYFDQNVGSARTITLHNLPTDGRDIHATLFSNIEDRWDENASVYKAASSSSKTTNATLSSDVIRDCAAPATTLTYNLPDIEARVQIGSAIMTGWLQGSGQVSTGAWVTPQMIFTLIDRSGQEIARTRAEFACAGAPVPSPVVIVSEVRSCTDRVATVTWTVDNSTTVQIRVGSARGVVMTGLSTGSGHAETGPWVNDGMIFVLVDAAGEELARTTAKVHCGPDVPNTSSAFVCTAIDPVLGVHRPQAGVNPSADKDQISLNSAGDLRCKWHDRSTLTVGFYSGDQSAQQRILSYAKEWELYSHINFSMVPVDAADIRIGFRPDGGFNSYVGTCSSQGQTMNYETIDPPRHVVLHEFGHALGLVHEHQSPAASIPWNRPAVYDYYWRTYHWDSAKVDTNLFQRRDSTNYTDYDPKSIMQYPVPKFLTDGSFEIPENHELSFLDKTFMNVWTWNGPWVSWPSAEDQYLVGNWDNGSWNGNSGGPGDKISVRRAHWVLMSFNYDGVYDFLQGYGIGNGEDAYLVGDWDGDKLSNLAVRRGNCVLMDTNFDDKTDRTQCFGNGNAESQYLVGDWDGDGRDNLAVRRGNCVLMDTNFDDKSDRTQCFGNGDAEIEYLVGDWDGDGRDNLAVRRSNVILMDFNFDSVSDRRQVYGNGR
jgi:hypothetical protein